MALTPKPATPAPYTFRDEPEVLQHARTLIGCTAGEVAAAIGQMAYLDEPKAQGKTGVGGLVEWYFGKPPNNSPEPDIPELAIEIKTIPLEQRGRTSRQLGPKEPTSLTMMDYARVAEEGWQQAYVRKKLHRILWIPYIHDFDDKRKHTFQQPFLWSPAAHDLPYFEQDYEVVRQTILAGKAHQLSETLSVVLAARRKGIGADKRKQPKSPILAPSRAWALKSAYTSTVLDHQAGLPSLSILELAEAARRKYGAVTEIARRLQDVRTLNDALLYVVEQFRSFEGLDTAAIAARMGKQVEQSKNRHSAIVRNIIGLPRRGNVIELEKLGIRLHVLDVDPATMRPHEAVPFPAMVLRTFAEETWESSQLAEHVDRIIFVPTFSEGGTLGDPHYLGKAFLWTPTPADWTLIEAEWRAYQSYVRECRLETAPKASATQRIHMRPHGRKSLDVDFDPCRRPVTKQCFWLNSTFVASILKANHAPRSRTDSVRRASS